MGSKQISAFSPSLSLVNNENINFSTSNKISPPRSINTQTNLIDHDYCQNFQLDALDRDTSHEISPNLKNMAGEKNHHGHETCISDPEDSTKILKNSQKIVECSKEQSGGSQNFIVRGTISQGDAQFKLSSNKQCTAIAAMSICIAAIEKTTTWTTDVIDYIVINGNICYNNCIKNREPLSANSIDSHYLRHTEILLDVTIPIEDNVDDKITLIRRDPIRGHLVNDNGADFPSLKNLLNKLIYNNVTGILSCHKYSVAILSNEEGIGIFDSHSRDAAGKATSDGVACYIFKTSVEEVLEILLTNFKVREEPKTKAELQKRPFTEDNQYEFTEFQAEVQDIVITHSQKQNREKQKNQEKQYPLFNSTLKDAASKKNHRPDDMNMVINMPFFWYKLHEAFDDHFGSKSECSFKNIVLASQTVRGYMIVSVFKCNKCGYSIKIDNVAPESLDLNLAAVMATQTIGIGYQQQEEHSAIFGLHSPCNSTWQKKVAIVAKATIAAAEESFKKAAEKEKALATRFSIVNKIPRVPVQGDGCFLKRVYQYSRYDSSGCCVIIISFNTLEILDIYVLQNRCSTCDRSPNPDPNHKCFRSHAKELSSTSMEKFGFMKIFERSMAKHGLIYDVLVSDGDSANYKAILESNPYAEEMLQVKNIQCSNHIKRNFSNNLKSLATGTIGTAIKTRFKSAGKTFSDCVSETVDYFSTHSILELPRRQMVCSMMTLL